eukprot:TRINITY_DN25947_c0_g1_i1.p1 TRINITY_DN25947_c0_g1~~TRINITY_DN25947_c0_g1_i1.p1  ORF type:complete len:560 (-),score=103.06 TRINITY_DN25947_c0_g1_i1:16-1653(-)
MATRSLTLARQKTLVLTARPFLDALRARGRAGARADRWTPVAVGGWRTSRSATNAQKKWIFAAARHAGFAVAAQARSSAGSARAPESPPWRWWHFWNYQRARQLVRGLRTAFLALALYNIGVAEGLQKYATDPEGERRKLIMKALEGSSAVDTDQRPKIVDRDAPEVQVVRRVFPRVLKAALEECRSLEKRARKELDDVSNSVLERSRCQKRLTALQAAKTQLKNWPVEGFLVLDVGTPNAFVTAMVPRMIFIHSGLFQTHRLLPVEDPCKLQSGAKLVAKLQGDVTYECPKKSWSWTPKENETLTCSFVRAGDGNDSKECVVQVRVRTAEDVDVHRHLCVATDDLRSPWAYSVCTTDEQLAMLLAHELSHVIHQHSREALQRRAQALALQMVLLATLDPTGLLTLAVEACMGSTLHYGFHLPHSREQEFEADATGLRIVARALYDPRDASSFFGRLLELSEVTGSTSESAWKSTHPPHEDRLNALREQEVAAVKRFEAERQRPSRQRRDAALQPQRAAADASADWLPVLLLGLLCVGGFSAWGL